VTTPITTTSQLEPDGIWGYRKAIGSFLAVVIALIAQAWGDGTITSAEWGTVALGAASAAVATFLLPNAIKQTPPAPVAPVDEV
jgi:uncharacterized membrane protein